MTEKVLGKLLYEVNSIPDDQLDNLKAISKSRNHENLNLALLSDGLKAERDKA